MSSNRRWETVIKITIGKLAPFALAGVLAISEPADSRADTIYNINVTVGSGNVTGAIQTDGTMGALSAANVRSWYLTLFDGELRYVEQSGVDTTTGLRINGRSLTATQDGLYWNFDTSTGAFLDFNQRLCFDDGLAACAGPGTVSLEIKPNKFISSRYKGNVKIAEVESQPPKPPPVQSASCLEKQNDKKTLSWGEVYENGKFKFRITRFGTDQSGAYLDTTSNSTILNYRWRNSNGVTITKFQGSDRNLCRGVEISIYCVSENEVYPSLYKNYGDAPWDCRISEF